MVGNQFRGLEHLKELPMNNGAIDLSKLIKMPGGGTHDIYRIGDNPTFLLKVVRDSIGNENDVLQQKLTNLTIKYAELYKTFGEDRCLVEKRCIHLIKEKEGAFPQNAVVSFVAYDNCFKNENKFGFNTEAVETMEHKIKANPLKYHLMNKSLMGDKKSDISFSLEDFLLFHESFRPIFSKLESEPSLQAVMKEFLEKFRSYYKQTDQLMDFTGLDNVVFYKEGEKWQYKVGSVIKHETGKHSREMIRAIDADPSIVQKSFKNWTPIFFVPSWVRILNATAAKLGMEKIVEDITVSQKDSENLSRMFEMLSLNERAVFSVQDKEFEEALRLFKQYQSTEKDHDTRVRYFLGVNYCRNLQNQEAKRPKQEIKAFLELLMDPKNVYPEPEKAKVDSVIHELQAKLLSATLEDLEESVKDNSLVAEDEAAKSKSITFRRELAAEKGSSKETVQTEDKINKNELTPKVASSLL